MKSQANLQSVLGIQLFRLHASFLSQKHRPGSGVMFVANSTFLAKNRFGNREADMKLLLFMLGGLSQTIFLLILVVS